jgi:hypothetical protein
LNRSDSVEQELRARDAVLVVPVVRCTPTEEGIERDFEVFHSFLYDALRVLRIGRARLADNAIGATICREVIRLKHAALSLRMVTGYVWKLERMTLSSSSVTSLAGV